MALLNSYGGVTATLKRAIELQPAAEGRSLQVVIDFAFLLGACPRIDYYQKVLFVNY